MNGTYGWETAYGIDDDGFPMLRLTKGQLWVEIHGEAGIDPDILLERALISALEIDLGSAATPEEQTQVMTDLARARATEQISEQMRRNAVALVAAQTAA